MVFPPDGGTFFTERSGRVRVIKDGKLQPTPFFSVPKIVIQRRKRFDEHCRRILFSQRISSFNKQMNRIRGVAEAPDGSIYFSFSNRDGRDSPKKRKMTGFCESCRIKKYLKSTVAKNISACTKDNYSVTLTSRTPVDFKYFNLRRQLPSESADLGSRL